MRTSLASAFGGFRRIPRSGAGTGVIDPQANGCPGSRALAGSVQVRRDHASAGTLCLLLLAVAPVNGRCESAASASIPEPTELSVVATRTDARLLWSRDVDWIRSADAKAAITAIEVAGQEGQRIPGISISLSSSDAVDTLYLAESELHRFLDELAELASSVELAGSTRCEATTYCLTGIARCRPSQAIPQAFCPGIFTSPTRESGFALSTPRRSFMFPSVGPSNFAAAMRSAARALEERTRGNGR